VDNLIGFSSANANGNATVSFARNLSADDLNDLGAPENAVVVIRDENGNVLGCGQLEEGTLRFETPEEMANRLHARAVMVADGNGDATFPNLPAGCYDFIISAPGFEDVIGHECLGPGETVTNTITLTPIVVTQGTLVKRIILPTLTDPVTGLSRDFTFASEILFCDATLVGGNATPGAVAASGFCNDVNDAAVVAHGGVDNLTSGMIGPDFEFRADVHAGDYFICWSAEITFTPPAPGEVLTVPYRCEGPYNVITDALDGFVVDGPATADRIQALDPELECGEPGIAVLDVTVLDDTGAPVEGATVLAALAENGACPADMTAADQMTTDANGEADFDTPGGGDYCVQVLTDTGEVDDEMVVVVDGDDPAGDEDASLVSDQDPTTLPGQGGGV